MHTLAARCIGPEMSTVELIAFQHERAANAGPRFAPKRDDGVRTAARGFLIQLVAREVQLVGHSPAWLRAAGRALASAGVGEQVCEQLATEAVTLREELHVLAHRLVARWNWSSRRRPELSSRPGHRAEIDIAALLAQPSSPAVAELIALHERNVNGPTPWLELAALRPIEQMLAATVPLAIDVARLDDAELTDAALLFEGREQRARELATLLSRLIAADPRRATSIAIVEEQAVAAFTNVLAECAKPVFRLP
jgi:hypothetical protein